jgi:hypothetical protein
VAVRADFEVQLRLGRPGLPGRPAGAPGFDVVVLGVNGFLHGGLLGNSEKLPLYTGVSVPDPPPSLEHLPLKVDLRSLSFRRFRWSWTALVEALAAKPDHAGQSDADDADTLT